MQDGHVQGEVPVVTPIDRITDSAVAERASRVIRTPDQRLRVFVSSTLQELAAERAVAKEAIEALHLAPVLFELGARPHPPRDLYRAYLAQSHIFVGIYWQRYGWVAPGMEISGLEDEYRLSAGMPRLLYIKRPAPEREARLEELLERIRNDDLASYKPFDSLEELRELIAGDLVLLLTEQFEQARAEHALPHTPAEPVPALPEVPLPSGTVTFLFTDIVGSTRLWEQEPAAMGRATTRHDALVEQVVAQHGGVLVRPRGEGDSRFVAFERATEAVRAASALQQALFAEPWPTSTPLRVRMALHTGEADLREGDYYGPTVNRCARLRAVAHGGQTLLSQATNELVRDALPLGADLLELGEYRLKDLFRPERIFQLIIPGLPRDFPPLQSLDQLPNNLPVQRTRFVGRRREVAEVSALLRRDDVALVTLTGAGGVGKTRLALQVAAELVEEFADGVFFVNLAPLTDPNLVLPTIASVLEVREEGALPLAEQLAQYLHDKSLLLLLDNFERVVEAAEALDALTAAAPGLKVLVTSRMPLHLYGEQEFHVPPLTVPTMDALPPLDRLTQYEAVRLFIERARAVKQDFQATNENAPAIAEICARLDGLPLAIELAAARSKLFTPQALLARLSHRLQLLTGGARNLPPRQQTLRAAIDWSYTLLEEPVQTLFSRLAVFAGGGTLDAIETVCTVAEGCPLDIFDGISSLVDKSLLRQEEGSGGETRFVMLQTIHEYARERLDQSGEGEALERAHAAYYLALAEEAEPHMTGAEQVAWLECLEQEHDNLRAALRRGNTEVALRLAGVLWRFWYLRGYLSEGRAWLTTVLHTGAGEPTATRARAFNAAGNLAYAEADYAAARALYEESLALFREVGGKRGIAHALNNLGNLAAEAEDYTAARALYEESLALFREVGDKAGITNALNNLGAIANEQADYAAARALHEESLAIRRAMGDKHGMASSLNNLGNLAYDQGDYVAARTLFEKSLALFREVGDKWSISHSLEQLAALAATEGTPERAAHLWGAADALRAALGAPLPPTERVRHERAVAVARGELDEGAFAAAWAAGRAMAMEEAVAYALEEKKGR